MNGIESKIERLSFFGHDASFFRWWIIRMKMYLKALTLEFCLFEEQQHYNENDRKVRHILISHMTDSSVREIYRAFTAKEMWDIIMDRYQQVTQGCTNTDVTVPF